MRTLARGTLAALLVSLCCSCAKKTLVALVPDPDGRTGSITVTDEAGAVAMDAPYRTTTVRDVHEPPSEPAAVEREKIEEMFADALAISPPRPLHFLLYFTEYETLAEESVPLLQDILSAVRDRNAGYISVMGHADTLGTTGYNRDVSHRRALAVERMLIGNGVNPNIISLTWYGESYLLVPTPDETWERRNRAVEVIVR